MNEKELRNHLTQFFKICDAIDENTNINDTQFTFKEVMIFSIYLLLEKISKTNVLDNFENFSNVYLKNCNFDINNLNLLGRDFNVFEYLYKADQMYFLNVNIQTTNLLKSLYIEIVKFYTSNQIDMEKFTSLMNEIKFETKKIPNVVEVKKENKVNQEVYQENEKSIDDYMKELNDLVGLESVKNQVNSIINLVKINKIKEERGLPTPTLSLHLVFTGNPGTGKTTVARILAQIYKEIGALSTGKLVEVDRSALVGGYVGQTAIKTQEVIKEALGGILFIDEAYTLSSGKGESDFGQESIDTILKAMEDNRDDFIVIVAGYPDLMEEFINSNPGLKSRFNTYINFEDYSADELFEIFNVLCRKNKMSVDEKGIEYTKEYFNKLYENRNEQFANGRDVRNFFEKAINNQANRLVQLATLNDEDLQTFTVDDFINH